MVFRGTAALREIIEEAKDVRTYCLECPGFEYAPGQFINVYLLKEDGGFGEFRAYSISSSPTSGKLEFSVKWTEGFPSKLSRLKTGDKVGVMGPFGHFQLQGNDSVFLAGGIGVTPFISMVRHAHDKRLPQKLTLFYSCRTTEEAPFCKELAEMEGDYPNFKFVLTYTRLLPEHPWKGERGRISMEMVKKYIGNMLAHDYFVCGPKVMVDASKEMLLAAGVPKEKIKAESWG